MSLLHNEAITIKRYSTGSYEKGHFVEGTEISITGYANIQPLNGNELLQLPEGDRQKESIKVYSLDTVLRNKDILVDSNSNEYELQQVKNYSQEVIPHYKALGVKIN